MFQWDEHNEGHLRRHGVEPDEAEEALEDTERVDTRAYPSGDERRYAFIGRTEQGRVLVVVFSYREDAIRVVTTRDATARERRRYRRRGR